MKRLTVIALLGLTACGGFENEPFKTGVVRGQVTGADERALVSVIGREDLTTKPDAAGAFELAGVPLGQAELLIIANATSSRRLTVEVGGASVVELGVVDAPPSVKLEVHVEGGYHDLSHGTVRLVGTPLTRRIEVEGFESEAEFFVPAGCYEARASVPGLGQASNTLCFTDTLTHSLRVTFPTPDGSEGREGCSVTGCLFPFTCQSDRTCR
ncbi:MAG: hypothetical protein ACOZQL_23055 [Myxococcota bacterium]